MNRCVPSARVNTTPHSRNVLKWWDNVDFAALTLTIVWTAGGFTVYTYIGDIFARLGLPAERLGLVLLLFGAACLSSPDPLPALSFR